MLASKLVQALQTAIEKHGDVPVLIWDEASYGEVPFILEPPSAYVRFKCPEVWPCLTLRRMDRSIDATIELPD